MKKCGIARQALLLIAFAAACMTGIPTFGQATNTGTVVGQVTDPSGAVIPGAMVTLTSANGAVRLRAQTNGDGNYAMTTATKVGFSTTKAVGQVISVGTQSTINLQLKVGGASETVQVQVLGTELQTLNSTVGSTIAPEAIDSLPSLGHDASTFVELQPGVSPDGSVAGAVSDQSTFLLDGGNNSSDMDGNNTTYNTTAAFAGDPTGGVAANTSSYDLTGPPSGILPTPADSVEEVKVNTANQTADFDNSSGAQVEFVTRRGTNRWHGSAYEYYLDNGLDANTWDNNQYAVPIPEYHYNRFGARAGGFMTPNRWGQRFYIFGFYEGFRYPQSQTIERTVPSDNLKKGIVTFDGVNYDMATVDPRGKGISPVVADMWNKYEPEGNDPGCGALAGGKCDGVNELGFKANMSLPMKSSDLVFRMDHDFSTKWHWFTSYRYYKLTQLTTSQYDIGGFFSGDKIGVPTSSASRPLQPWYLVTGLTTNISANTTNDFHYSYLRNFWSWATNNAPPQESGLGGAIEPFGESSTSVLAPFNVNTQNIRTRFWDGQDHFFSDNVTMLKGNHLLQFGGQYQRNYDYHQRSDNGGGINFTPTYQLGESSGPGNIDMTDLGGGYPLNTNSERLAEAVLGIVAASQVAYTRSGSSLTLNPPLTHAFDQDTIPFYNAYFSDTWHMRPSLTVTYGMGYTLEMPPTEKNGKATVLVDAADEPVSAQDFLAQKKSAALAGGVYNPQVGFALVHNVGNGLKYPYQPFYGSFSPRIAAAWNPWFSKGTVVRGGYGRIYGRLNGVDLVLVPLLGVGLIQAVQCTQPFSNGTCGPNNPTAANAFRIGVDGSSAPLPAAAQTLPQPDFPGVNDIEAAAPEGMDPHFRPNAIDSFDITIQRQVGQRSLLEVGYIGRLVHHEFQPINLNAVPYMMSVGGQQFQTAYANLEKTLQCDKSEGACGSNVPSPYMSDGTTPNPAYASFINAVTPQAFLESALKQNGYCNGTMSNKSGTTYASCTAAVLDQELGNLTTQAVWGLWSDLDGGPFSFPHTMQNTAGTMSSGTALNASIGYGNYNGMFVTFSSRDWHGLTFQNNFTWSKALGTGALVQATSEYTANDPFNLNAGYGRQAFDRRLVYNAYMVAAEPWFQGQSGLLGRFAGGWTFSPIFTAGSGAPVVCGTWTGAQAWGAADGNDYYENEQCVFTSPYSGGHSAHFGVTGGTDNYGHAVGTETSATPVNMFKNPAAVWNQVRPPILGIDTGNSGLGPISGQPYWNVDAQLSKTFKITEATNFQFSFIAANVFNHREFFDPSMSLASPGSFGVLNTQNGNPRQMEFGGRVSF